MITKKNIVMELQEEMGGTKKEAEEYVNKTISIICNSLKDGETVSLAGLGSFEVKEYAPRKGRNPKTGEKIDIAAQKRVHFKPMPQLKNLVDSYIEPTEAVAE